MSQRDHLATDYEEKLVENFMICGIPPNVISRTLA